MEQCNKAEIWSSLEKQAIDLRSYPSLKQTYRATSSHITLDYSYHHINQSILNSLILLAEHCRLREKIYALFRGDVVNLREKRPALHTALRLKNDDSIIVNGKNIVDEIFSTREYIQFIVEKIRSKKWLGFSGKPITHIVNIGIGGSDLGARFCLQVFSDLIDNNFTFHFISDADSKAFKRVVANLQPETTLFIVASKSFTTEETLYNARKAKAWIGENRYEQHFIAVTADVQRALAFGINTVVPIWDWVGGRYSFCSGINLITAIAIGYDAFAQLLAGANSMDVHYQYAEFHENLPVLLGLLGIWNNNFLNIHHLLMLTYSQYLDALVPYIQQLEMESNGKSTDNNHQKVDYATCPIIWGGPGNQAQHSYYQLLCQGTHKMSVDLISIDLFDGEMLNEMCFSKIRVLSEGIHHDEDLANCIDGQVPLTHIRIKDYSPFSIGALIALYEHKVYTQSVIWNINPFDQPGVESAKHKRRVSSNLLGVTI